MVVMIPRLVLVDGYWCAIRAHFATRKWGPTNSRGEATGAIYGLSQALLRLREHVPSGKQTTHLAVMLDTHLRGSWRREIYPDYKAGRNSLSQADRAVKLWAANDDTAPLDESAEVLGGQGPMAADVRRQLDLLPEVCDAFGVQYRRAERYEADDLIHTYAVEARTDSDVWVFTGDKDLVQLVGDNVRLFSVASLRHTDACASGSGGSSSGRLGHVAPREDVVDLAQARKHWGVEPHQLADLLALAGDKCDGVLGIPGIGPVRAAALLRDYGDLEGVLAAASEGSVRTRGIGPKLAQALRDHADRARMMRRVVALHDVPGCNAAEFRTKFRLEPLNEERAIEFCSRHDFNSLIHRITKEPRAEAPESAE